MRLKGFRNPKTWPAALMLLGMGIILVCSSWKNSYIADESLQVTAGYTYLKERNLRLNPEDPPLGKDIAALPLLMMNLKLPRSLESLKPGAGRGDSLLYSAEFLFGQIAPPEKILLGPRLLMITITLLMGLFLFYWARTLWGGLTAYITLSLFILSPTILAYTPFVTLDVPAAFGATLAIYFFLRVWKEPTYPNALKFGLMTAVTLLLKFSLSLLLPYFGILLPFLIRQKVEPSRFWRELSRYFPKFALSAFAGITLFFLIYEFHFVGFPFAQQAADAKAILADTRFSAFSVPLSAFAYLPGIRILLHIVLGMTGRLFQSDSLNYLFGHGYMGGRLFFLPLAYFLKETIPFHVLTGMALYLAFKTRQNWEFDGVQPRNFFRKNVEILVFSTWILFYGLAISLLFQANLDLRSLLPIYPFILVLVARGCALFLEQGIPTADEPTMIPRKLRTGWVVGLLAWLAVDVGSTYPSFMTFFNAFAGHGGSERFALVDSNLELGQDVRRLAEWAESRNIKKIAVPHDFQFVWTEDPQLLSGTWFLESYKYYLKDRYQAAHSTADLTGWIAVPATLLQWATAMPASGSGWGSDTLRWLQYRKPVDVIGNSIYVYYVDPNIPTPPHDPFVARISTAQLMVARHPSSDSYLFLGYMLQWANRLNESRTAYQKAIELNPRNVAAHNNLGLVYNLLNFKDESLSEFRRALEIDPTFELAKRNLASVQPAGK